MGETATGQVASVYNSGRPLRTVKEVGVGSAEGEECGGEGASVAGVGLDREPHRGPDGSNRASAPR